MEKLTVGARQLGLALTSDQVQQFQRYYEELVAWNRRLNLTAITDYDAVQVRHFLDSLTVLLALEDVLPEKVLDVGSGAGFPGLPLKIVKPQLEMTLLEATAKKARFLEHMIESLSLEGLSVVVGRAEEMAHLPEYRERFDLVLARGLAPLPTLLELTLPFCRVGGRLVAHRRGAADAKQIEAALRTLGGQWQRQIHIGLPELADGRGLLVIAKVGSTPERFPRRPGMPRKRPL